MNNQLIEKLMRINNESCPKLIFTNPLLDQNIVKSLSHSFVKILNLSEQHSKVSNNARLALLENLRKMCKIEPENHTKVDENYLELLYELYDKNVTDSTGPDTPESLKKKLDAHLIRRLNHLGYSSNFNSSLNPEIVQAMINLNRSDKYLEELSQDIINWDTEDSKYMKIVEQLWNNDSLAFKFINKFNKHDDIALKMKAIIEKLLLNACYNVLSNREVNINDVISTNNSLMHLVKRCSKSCHCFQMCTSLLNFLFIMTCFDTQIQKFIEIFVKNVKQNCPEFAFSTLYPIEVNYVVVLLDIELNELPEQTREQYVEFTLKYLRQVHSESENDLIMVLSHFPIWFDIYNDYKNKGEKMIIDE